MLISIYFLLRNHRSGVYSDPSSVASIASLIHHPETTRDFKDLDPLAPKKKLLKQLSGRRYRLESYIAPNGLERYGIVSTADSGPEHRNAQYTSLDQARMPPLEKKSKKSHMINIGMNLVLTISIVGLLTLITYYTQTSSGPFEDFMDSQNFGPRFLLTVVGIIIKAQWSRLERLAAANAPLEKLYNPTPSGSVRSTILAQRTLNPISTVGVALANSNPFAALLGFTALLAEILIILLPGVPFSSGQLYTWARATWYTCMALLGFMCIVMIAVWAKFRVSWPKQPNTIGAMAVYLADSILAEELAPLATASEKEREAAVLGWGRDCELRRWRERDGREKWTIDFEGAR